MTKPLIVGLVSDTHGVLRPELLDVFAGVDVIVHAGDVGHRGVLDGLMAVAPTEAVSGNVDDRDDPMLPRHRTLPVGELTLHVSHGDELSHPTAERLLAQYTADIVVFGHTHRPVECRGGGRIAVNPGSAGPRRFSLPVTAARLTVVGRDVQVEFITLV